MLIPQYKGDEVAKGGIRLALTFRVIGLLVSTEPAGTCVLVDGFLLAPLPAHKKLWEGTDAAGWSRGSGESVFGIKAGGKMVRLDREKEEDGNEEASSANWLEWCVGMDGIGALVMLAASLDV
jgi:hypothetical protein